MTVTWSDANQDLVEPMQEVLEGIALLETKDDATKAADAENPLLSFTTSTTPYSLQVITAGALAFSQQAAKVVASLGGVTAILAAIKGIWYTSNSTEAAAMVGGAAFVLAALFVALAIIVRADVQARSLAQAAEYQARAQVAARFLRGTEGAAAGSPAAIRKYFVQRAGTLSLRPVDEFKLDGGGLIAVLDDDAKTVVKAADIVNVTYASIIK